MASIDCLGLDPGDMTVLCGSLSSLVGRNVVSEMGKASAKPLDVVHDAIPLPSGKIGSPDDVFEGLLGV